MVDPAVLARKRSSPIINKDYFKETSSLNPYYICDSCNKRVGGKPALCSHLKSCQMLKNVKCNWCNVVMTNPGNLAAHMLKIHNNVSLENNGKMATNINKHISHCVVCDKPFTSHWQLRFHVRRYHFNLMARTLNFEIKKVNQVWFERVLDSNIVMEVRKTGQNALVLRKLGPNTAIKVQDSNNPVEDLNNLYPTSKNKKAKCEICKVVMLSRCIGKHVEEKHLNIRKHHCNNCNTSFKRLYLFVRHVCFKTRARRWAVKPKDLRTRLLDRMPHHTGSFRRV